MANYIDKKKFKQLLQRYRLAKLNNAPTKQVRALFNEIGKCFLQIAWGFLNRPNVINYSLDRKNEMVSDAVFYMSKYVDRYDTSRPNPFSYFTQVAKNACLQRITFYKKREKMFQSIEFIDNMEERQ